MSLQLASLNSGSNGNCYYVGNSTEAILIDAGISCKEVEKRLQRLGLSIQIIKAIFVTHEHTDHISGVQVLANKYSIPVYITQQTYLNSRLKLQQELVIHFSTNDQVVIGNLSVKAFKKYHDACDPHSFIVQHNSVNIGVFTDIGRVCPEVVYHFKLCTAVILESNYDVEMLTSGNYPYHLKKRISNGFGHLSNDEAVQLFTKYNSKRLSHLVLSHLSKNNNCPIKVEQLFKSVAGDTQIIVASRYQETAVYNITEQPVNISKRKIALMPKHQSQLTLF